METKPVYYQREMQAGQDHLQVLESYIAVAIPVERVSWHVALQFLLSEPSTFPRHMPPGPHPLRGATTYYCW